jgi:UDP-3-O-[3-hydroxymyristoyl] glucosamine N-acyltransferase
MTISELAAQIGAEVVGDGSITIDSAATLEQARPGQVSFLSNPRYVKQLATTKASAVIVGLDVQAEGIALLRTADPYYGFAQAVVALHGHRRHPFTGVHPHTFVDPTATLGEGTIVYPGAFIGPRAKLGRECIVYPNVTIYDDTVIGDRVIIHAGAVIGADGFGFATHRGVHHKIPQVGNVVIEDDVEIGANTCIDRAATGSTQIGKGAKIDDLVMIGHNVRIGPGCLIVAQVGIAGSVTIGRYTTIAGQVGIAGHLTIGDQVTIAAGTGISGSLPDGVTVWGYTALPLPTARRVYTALGHLPELVERVRELERQVRGRDGERKADPPDQP